jgi:hypothetical protein
MGGAPLVIPLVGLVFPIALLLLAILFDLAVLAWAAYRVWTGRLLPRLRALASVSVASRADSPRV